jgi:hypothetical protein
MASVTYSTGVVIGAAWLNDVNGLTWTGAWPTPLPLSNITNITMTGNLSATGPSSTIGYGTGSGGTVTQATSKTTSVTLNKGSGNIIMNGAALAANTTVRFQFNNSLITNADIIPIQLNGLVAATSSYNVWIDGVGTGFCFICVRNISGGSLSEVIVLNYSLIKGSTS